MLLPFRFLGVIFVLKAVKFVVTFCAREVGRCGVAGEFFSPLF